MPSDSGITVRSAGDFSFELKKKKRGETARVSIAEFIMRYHAAYLDINHIHIDRYEIWIYHLQIPKNIISTPPMRSSCTLQHLRDSMGGQTAAQSRPLLDVIECSRVFSICSKPRTVVAWKFLRSEWIQGLPSNKPAAIDFQEESAARVTVLLLDRFDLQIFRWQWFSWIVSWWLQQP